MGESNLAILSFISWAALFVKVIKIMFWGFIPFSRISQAALWVRALVLPLPAPARISSGVPQCVTESCWLGLS